MQVDDIRSSRLVEYPVSIAVEHFREAEECLGQLCCACSCVRWRTAAAETPISYLHLHADRPSYNSSWRSFFQSRRSIACLKLTSDVRHHRQSWASQMAQSLQQGLCINHIPQSCRALSVSEDILPEGTAISGLVRLQQLQPPGVPAADGVGTGHSNIRQSFQTWQCSHTSHNWSCISQPNVWICWPFSHSQANHCLSYNT